MRTYTPDGGIFKDVYEVKKTETDEGGSFCPSDKGCFDSCKPKMEDIIELHSFKIS